MITVKTFKVKDGEAVAKRAFYKAWKACGSTSGAGFLQDKPGATEDDVWNNIVRQADYPFMRPQDDGVVMADYVFGRMMKLRIEYNKDSVKVKDEKADVEYQRWAIDYHTYSDLIEAAIKELNNDNRTT